MLSHLEKRKMKSERPGEREPPLPPPPASPPTPPATNPTPVHGAQAAPLPSELTPLHTAESEEMEEVEVLDWDEADDADDDIDGSPATSATDDGAATPDLRLKHAGLDVVLGSGGASSVAAPHPLGSGRSAGATASSGSPPQLVQASTAPSEVQT